MVILGQQYEFDQDEEICVSHAKIPAGSMKLLSKLKEYQTGILELACWGDSMLTSLKSQCMTLQISLHICRKCIEMLKDVACVTKYISCFSLCLVTWHELLPKPSCLHPLFIPLTF